MKKIKLEKGITLIALIITIVVLLILAVVTIGTIKDSKIITHAQNAANDYIIGGEKEQIELAYGEYKISKINNPSADLQVKGASNVSRNATDGWTVEFETGNKYIISPTGEITKDEPIVYDPEGWKYAWTSDGTTWSDIIEKLKLEEGTKVEGKIIAKIYETEETIGAMNLGDMNISEGKACHLKIDVTEGAVGMPSCMNNDKGEWYAWFGAILKYTSGEILDPIFPHITKVIIGEGITSIPQNEFCQCISLKEVNIAAHTTGDYSFVGCANLKTVIMENSVLEIGESAFEGCDNLTTIIIPGSVKTIDQYAFRSCEKLNTVIMENGVTEIGSNAFNDCSNLTKIIIPNSVTKIGGSAFENCENLSSIIIPKSVLNIESRAFMSCKKLKNIYIETTSSDFKVGSIAFRNIAENSTIYVRNDAIATQLNKKDGTYSKYDLETTTISNDYNWTAPTI